MDFIPMCIPYIGEEEAQAVYDQIKSGWISMGKRVQEFEAHLADYLGVKHVVACNNGTSTLHAAALAMGIGPGDEVLIPALSYISSANVVLFCGAKPVFVQEDPRTFNVEAEEFERHITPRTKAIMPVDLKGLPVNYDAIMEMARRHNLPVIADSAEAFGAKYKDALVGSQGDIHSFSMFANKNVTAGEGGFLTTNDDDLADQCRVIRNQGQDRRYHHIALGHNYRMTDVTAAFAIEQVKRIEWVMDQKQELARIYDEGFAGHELFTTPHVPDYATRPSWYMYCLTLDENIDRDAMVAFMRKSGVDHRLSFPPIPLQPLYRERFGYKDGDFPISEKIFEHFVDLPNYIGITNAQFKHVIDTVRQSAEKAYKASIAE